MTIEDVLSLPGRDHPVLCADGQYGLLCRFPAVDDLCGVQVPGEHDLRWIPAANLDASPGGALAERHATA